MLDNATRARLAELRRRIDEAGRSCLETEAALARARRNAAALPETTPFLGACAAELESLAARMRRVAAEAATPHFAD